MSPNMSKNKVQPQNNTDQIKSYKTLYAIFQVCLHIIIQYISYILTKYRISLILIYQITGIIIVCCVYYWIVNYRGGFSFTVPKIIFNWHALLMTIAFIYLLANCKLYTILLKLKYILFIQNIVKYIINEILYFMKKNQCEGCRVGTYYFIVINGFFMSIILNSANRYYYISIISSYV